MEGSNTTAENTQIIGGVCGGLSYFGTMAAQAHGIPAYPVGQPGHCAYAVRVKRGEWKGGFGGPDGGMHNHIFGSQAPTSYLLMENVFADNDKADQAYLWAAQARLDEASGNKDKAIQAWEEALRQTPLHPFFRTELQRLLMEKEGMPVDWYVYAKDALSHYQGNGFAAFDILKDVQNKFLMDIPPADRIAWFRDLHEAIATTPTSWAVKFQPVLDSQSAFLANPQEKAAYLETVLSTHLKTGDGTNFGQALEWGVKNFVENGQADVFSNAFAKVAQQTGKTGTSGKAPDPKKLKEAYGKAIYATETARSIPAFQALSKAAASFSGANATNNTVKASIPQGWKLVPADGMVRCSTTSQWDSPWDHINLLRPCGGAQHTDKEANPNVIVELKNGVNLAGLVVTKRDGNENRDEENGGLHVHGRSHLVPPGRHGKHAQGMGHHRSGRHQSQVDQGGSQKRTAGIHATAPYPRLRKINSPLTPCFITSIPFPACWPQPFLSAPVQAALPAYSAVKDEAKTVNKYMIVVWAGTDWSPKSREITRAVEHLAKNTPEPVLWCIQDEREEMTEEEQKLPKPPGEIWNIPALQVVSPTGNMVFLSEGVSRETLPAVMKQAMEAVKQQNKANALWKKAAASSGTAAALLYGEGLQQLPLLCGLLPERIFWKKSKRRDPEDIKGVHFEYTFRHLPYIEKCREW